MSEYDVTLKREGEFWLVYVGGVPGLTQARRFGEVETMAREYISLVLDEEIDSVGIRSVSIAGLAEKLERAAADRDRARDLEASASALVREVAQDLRAESVSLAEIGAILGVSHQRAHQLVNAR
jgi:hypothetical protein